MGRSLTELLDAYLDDPDEGDQHPSRRHASPDQVALVETALQLAAAVATHSVVGIARAAADGPTVVRLAGPRDIERSLLLGQALADDDSRGLADVEAEHFVVRSGDRLRLGVDRGWELDAEQRSLLQGIALLAARGLAATGVGPLGSAGSARVARGPATTDTAMPTPAVTGTTTVGRASDVHDDVAPQDEQQSGPAPGSMDLGTEVA